MVCFIDINIFWQFFSARKWHRVFICLLESSELLKKWKFIARELDITEAEIEFLENKYRDNIKEQAFQMMLKWKEKKGKRATRRVFVDALENQSLTTCAGQNLWSYIVDPNENYNKIKSIIKFDRILFNNNMLQIWEGVTAILNW